MKKIILTVGVSGAGKSTFASKLVQENPLDYVLVNRDKIRELLYGYTESSVVDYYLRPDINKLEKQVTIYEDTLINEGLAQNKTVIIDATHLSKEYIEKHKFWNVPIEIVWFDVTLEEALYRNSLRLRKVDETVVKKQYDKYSNLRKTYVVDFIEPVKFVNNPSLPPCIVVDLDGCLCWMGERSAFDWHRVAEDTVVESVKELIQSYISSDIEVIFCSGRDSVCKNDTYKWLIEHLELKYDNNGKLEKYYPKIGNLKLLMRTEKDSRADWIIKEELWREIAKTNYIINLIDDRNSVVRRARALGLKVFQVEYHNF